MTSLIPIRISSLRPGKCTHISLHASKYTQTFWMHNAAMHPTACFQAHYLPIPIPIDVYSILKQYRYQKISIVVKFDFSNSTGFQQSWTMSAQLHC